MERLMTWTQVEDTAHLLIGQAGGHEAAGAVWLAARRRDWSTAKATNWIMVREMIYHIGTDRAGHGHGAGGRQGAAGSR